MKNAHSAALALMLAMGAHSVHGAQAQPGNPTPGAVTGAATASTTAATRSAVSAASTTASPDSSTAAPGSDPQIQRTVIEDDSAVIEELRVRGHTQRITVASKRAGVAPYEIIVGDGSRDTSDGPDNARGATGKRVWKLFSF